MDSVDSKASVNIERRMLDYGGRGFFGNTEIPVDQELLRVLPYTWVIFRPFKKEVCAFCFNYDNGRTWKVKLKESGKRVHAGLYFCCQECKDQWIELEDFDGLLSSTLDVIEQRIKIKQGGEREDPKDDLWSTAKPLKQPPALESEEYDLARLVATVVVRKYRQLVDEFDDLQSNEAQFLDKFPFMMESHVNVYQFLQCILPKKFKSILSPELVRQTVGREAGNAFGIWQQPLTLESECLGTAIYTQASFFNHSCEPNVQKIRMGREMAFKTLRMIQPDEQLCISYGMIDHLPLNERIEQLLSQWFFQCQCSKCLQQQMKL